MKKHKKKNSKKKNRNLRKYARTVGEGVAESVKILPGVYGTLVAQTLGAPEIVPVTLMSGQLVYTVGGLVFHSYKSAKRYLENLKKYRINLRK